MNVKNIVISELLINNLFKDLDYFLTINKDYIVFYEIANFKILTKIVNSLKNYINFKIVKINSYKNIEYTLTLKLN